VTAVTLSVDPRDNGALLAAAVADASTTLDVASYAVSPDHAGQLVAAHRHGVNVRLLLSDRSELIGATRARLHGSGVVMRAMSFPEPHAKLLLVDGARLLVGSGNLTDANAPPDPAGAGSRDWWAAVEGDPDLCIQAGAAFNAMWNLPPVETRVRTPASKKGRGSADVVRVPALHLRPTRVEIPGGAAVLHVGAPAGTTWIDFVSSARTRLRITFPYVSPRGGGGRLEAAVCAAARGGVPVRLLLGRRDGIARAMAARLRAAGVELRAMDPLRTTVGHAKGMVVDGSVLLGSANWSGHGLGPESWEALLLVRDAAAAAAMAAVFDSDWESGLEVAA
jgi:phosphatidylserine/phosphatidylglycerophosphate/cardiolipin synthase-like enzyme